MGGGGGGGGAFNLFKWDNEVGGKGVQGNVVGGCLSWWEWCNLGAPGKCCLNWRPRKI